MGVREGLLALLASGADHGYQLRGSLEEAVGSLWSVNVGQVYTTLQRLERDGLVVAEGEQDDSGRLPYALTAAGRDEVLRWLTTGEPTRDDVRDELVLKVLLARRTGLADPQLVIDRQRAETMAALQQLTRRRADLAATDLAVRLQLDRLALLARAELDWLDLAEERLAAAPPPDTTTSTSPDPVAIAAASSTGDRS